MDKHIFETLRGWSQAYKIASENSAMILLDSSQVVMDECSRRMQALQRFEEELALLEGKPGIPKALQRYYDAKNDMPCASCMYGAAGPVHAECRRKTDQYFRAVELLYVYASTIAAV